MAKKKEDEVTTETPVETESKKPTAPTTEDALRFQFFIPEDTKFVSKNQKVNECLPKLKPNGWNYVNIPESLGLDKKVVVEELTQAGALRAMFIGTVQVAKAQ